MKTMLAILLFIVTLAGCATHPVSKSKRQQVELATQTGIYSYQRALGPPAGR